MIEFDNGSASFNPPSLNFEHEYNGAILIFDDGTWEEILKVGNTEVVKTKLAERMITSANIIKMFFWSTRTLGLQQLPLILSY